MAIVRGPGLSCETPATRKSASSNGDCGRELAVAQTRAACLWACCRPGLHPGEQKPRSPMKSFLEFCTVVLSPACEHGLTEF